jgi:hypothetical protein
MVSDFRRNEAWIPASAGMTKNAVSYGAQDDKAREKKILFPGPLIFGCSNITEVIEIDVNGILRELAAEMGRQ